MVVNGDCDVVVAFGPVKPSVRERNPSVTPVLNVEIIGKCRVCESAAAGFSINGNFCQEHMELMVATAYKTLPELFQRFSKVEPEVVRQVYLDAIKVFPKPI